MTHLINLAAKDQQELVLDASNLTFFVDITDNSKLFADKDRHFITFHSTAYASERQKLLFDVETWNLNADLCQKKLSDAGHDFVKFPYVWGDQKYYGEAYINPDAVSAIITRQPFIPDGETEPHVAALIDVNGYGRFESYRVPERLMNDFSARVLEKRPHMDRIDPSVARSRFYQAGYVLYDPKQVNCIYQNGYDLDITFTGKHRIDFNLATRAPYEDSPQLRDSFASVVAAKGVGLVKLNSTNTYYTKLDDIVSVLRFDKQLQFTFENRSGMGGEIAWFEDEATAQSELQRITKMMSPSP